MRGIAGKKATVKWGILATAFDWAVGFGFSVCSGGRRGGVCLFGGNVQIAVAPAVILQEEATLPVTAVIPAILPAIAIIQAAGDTAAR